jgi:hypothetical protein
MKIWLFCDQCNKETGNEFLSYYPTEIVEDKIYDFTCPKGHNSKFHLQSIKYQLLFQSAFKALLEGYFLEATLGFTASLERFYEFFCKFVCFKNKIPEKEVVATWKQISNQSERQYGAFLFLYILEQKEAFDQKKFQIEALKKFRNKVIHKGYLPDEKETVKYGEDVFNLISNVSVMIAQKDKELFHSFSGKELMQDPKIQEEHPGIVSMGMSTMLNMTYEPIRLLEKDFRKEYNAKKDSITEAKQKELVLRYLEQQKLLKRKQ